MREARRLALARRQMLLAEVARREAISGLAQAVEEETKSAQLADRSAKLVRDYSKRTPEPEGASLRDQAAFLRSLQRVHEQAGEAHADAKDQSRWQSRNLAAAQSRSDRMEQRMQDARKELVSALERRDPPLAAKMARKLQNSLGEGDAPASATKPRKKP